MTYYELGRVAVKCPTCQETRLGHDPNENGLDKAVTCVSCGTSFKVKDGLDLRSIERAKDILIQEARDEIRRAFRRSMTTKIKF